jgi:hypothetical protein
MTKYLAGAMLDVLADATRSTKDALADVNRIHPVAFATALSDTMLAVEWPPDSVAYYAGQMERRLISAGGSLDRAHKALTKLAHDMEEIANELAQMQGLSHARAVVIQNREGK